MYPDLLGKRVRQYLYQHSELVGANPAIVAAAVEEALKIARRDGNVEFNVVKIKDDLQSITFLDYAAFFEDGFPLLRQYWTVNTAAKSSRYRSYQDSSNPPVLHRKELLLPKKHPQYPTFQALTQSAEAIGLFEDSSNIGFYQPWRSILKTKGFSVSGNSLLPIGNVEDDSNADEDTYIESEIARYRTALSRSNFSAPIQLLERLGYLSRNKTIFDYGCGKGDDLKGLVQNGISACGWDPHFAPDQKRLPASIVNLGFVINVIEDADERRDALEGAYDLANELLVVSVMLKHLEHDRGRPFNDGILTGRGTFQRYYSQEEILAYIKATLGEEPIPVAPGIAFIFKDKDEEQRFLSRRGRRAIVSPLGRRLLTSIPREQRRKEKFLEAYEANREILEALWSTWLDLGRLPESDELGLSTEIELRIGSLKKASNLLIANKGDDAEQMIRAAADARANEIALYLAKLQFERRTSYARLEIGLQRDIKALYGNYKAAQSAGLKLLYQVADAGAVLKACKEAEQNGIGWLDDEDALILHTSLIDMLPALLRCYIGCGIQLYGEASNADLIKIHPHSGKLTLMEFDDFENNPLPKMISRAKILLREQLIEFYDYVGEYPPPYLYFKSRFINEEFPSYEQQQIFEERLESIYPRVAVGYGPPALELDEQLRAKRYRIVGMKLERAHTIPDLDDPCGKYFKYRDFIECGETQSATALPNLPSNPQSYTALYDLATNVLDPIVDYYGMIKLTYGFCSHELSKKIKKRIAPKLDQHCSFERNRAGKFICNRGGAAVDFHIEHEDSYDVAMWIIGNVEFDRMYVYGQDKSIHLSYSSNPAKKSYQLVLQADRLLPSAFPLRNS